VKLIVAQLLKNSLILQNPNFQSERLQETGIGPYPEPVGPNPQFKN